MTRYEQELRKLFDGSGLMDRPQYSGRVCVGELGKDLRVRAEFFSAHVADQYDAIRLTVLNRKEGVVDRTLLQFKDVWGKKPVPSNPNFRSGVMPHLWDDHGDVDWYVYHPSAADYDSLRQAIGQYLSMFRERTPEWAQDGPKLVFICAPLRGDVEKNIEFARQKAQEVFADGDIPICPHLLFPPITDPKHPEQDKKVKEMSLRLLESCQQLNVYGPIWTDDMWKHIYRAGDLGIPVMTDQKAIGRTPPGAPAGRSDKTLDQERQKPSCPLIGQNGNIFHLMGLASRTLRQCGMADEAKEMQNRIMGGDCHSYEEALRIISEYVETELSPSISANNKKKENPTHER